MPQQPAIASTTQETSAKIAELRAKAGELKLHISDLEVRKSQLGEQRRAVAADVNPAAINKQLADVEHELTATKIQFEQLNAQIDELTTERDMARVFSLKGPPAVPGIATTAAPGFDPFQSQMEIAQISIVGGTILLLPLVVAFARRIWRRTPPATIDLENSPRLQRMEQAIEAIAVEVERIGEAQRFTTKLLSERAAEPIARVGTPRKEPGVITPH